MYNPYENMEEYNESVDFMIDAILKILNEKPTQIGQAALLYILTHSYRDNGHSLKDTLTEVANNWNHYE